MIPRPSRGNAQAESLRVFLAAAVCAPAAARSRYNPSRDHIASTLAFVSASISIIAGHGLSNPSAFHFRVASMPIFEP